MTTVGIKEYAPHSNRKLRLGEKFRKVINKNTALQLSDPLKLRCPRQLQVNLLPGKATFALAAESELMEPVHGRSM
jgi:hypothetical protein